MFDAIEADVVSSCYSPYPRIPGVFHDSSLALAALGGQYQLVATEPADFCWHNDCEDATALQYAILGGHEDIVRLLLSSKDYWQACLHLHAEFALRLNRPFLSSASSATYAVISPSEPPFLATAAKRGLEDVVKLSLDKGAERTNFTGILANGTAIPHGRRTRPANKVIIAVTIGKPHLIGSLIDSVKINVSPTEGNWEAFKTEIIDNPIDSISRAPVIAGSDKRGTMFDLYDISEQMSISP
ncbi:hypothetical protein VTN00DRAFT_5801 [Thermoascus crustaceus]|uniref:uncharacterized protein n=1 Tax=Thermoascus crustaceus TaxID=5088 RepID=UPI0037428F6A